MDHKYLKSRLKYDKDTGLFTWINSTTNITKKGSTAGTLVDGYILIQIDKKVYKAHRLAWLYMYEKLPEHCIDHINGIRDDNRIENLRDVTHIENMRNRRMHKNNTSGHTGIRWDNGRKKWVATIQKNTKKKQIGYFKEIEDAVIARNKAKIEYGYHENHS